MGLFDEILKLHPDWAGTRLPADKGPGRRDPDHHDRHGTRSRRAAGARLHQGAEEPCDMRKGFEGLHALIGEQLKENIV